MRFISLAVSSEAACDTTTSGVAGEGVAGEGVAEGEEVKKKKKKKKKKGGGGREGENASPPDSSGPKTNPTGITVHTCTYSLHAVI